MPRGKVIANKRRATGITQAELAEAITKRTTWKITQPRLSDVESEAFPMPRGFSTVYLATLDDLIAQRRETL